MSIEYKSGSGIYVLSYSQLKEDYTLFCEMTDAEFINRIPDAIHLACFICFLKEIPTDVCLSDTGIVHELVHLLKQNGTTTPLQDIRVIFSEQLKLT